MTFYLLKKENFMLVVFPQNPTINSIPFFFNFPSLLLPIQMTKRKITSSRKSKMAGSALAVSTTNKESEKPACDEWQIEYARFVNCSSSAFNSTHPSLVPVPKSRLRGAWISSSISASVKLIYERTSSGTDDAVLVLSLRSKTLEVHYISKMYFSWPQISCVLGVPARGSRAVFLSYKDGAGQMQKFALRFSDICEAEKFMTVVKEILGNGSPPLLQCPELNSEISSQAEAISYATIPKSAGELLYTQSVDEAPKMEPAFPPGQSTQLMLTSSAFEATQDSKPLEGVKTEAVYPPSFAQLVNSCRPAVSKDSLPSSVVPFDASVTDHLGAATKTGSGDLSTQFVKYLEGTPFKELLATVEHVISQLGDDVVM
ncbi:protein POOR HOMOLOGOUS SYNAPSIS 1-like [Salvia splendens]|uniref:protein POOR HOMOLOGOUS SYNAPSIS 1-like n=1 Tax=Salvia splendens TaxID=180675 RepID=UPI001C26FABE|nr:protein POOR HOMOLOGOUS SYNAPSIS 1-like [Salvia splendens]